MYMHAHTHEGLVGSPSVSVQVSEMACGSRKRADTTLRAGHSAECPGKQAAEE